MNGLDLCLEVVQGHVNHCANSQHSPLNSETVRDILVSSTGPPIGNGWPIGESNSHATDLTSRDPNTLRAQYLENSS